MKEDKKKKLASALISYDEPEISTSKSDKKGYYPSLSVMADVVDKGVDVGDTITLTIEAKVVGIHKSGTQNRVELEVQKIGKE